MFLFWSIPSTWTKLRKTWLSTLVLGTFSTRERMSKCRFLCGRFGSFLGSTWTLLLPTKLTSKQAQSWCWVCKVNGSFWSTSKFWDSCKVANSYHILNNNAQKKLQQDDQFFFLHACLRSHEKTTSGFHTCSRKCTIFPKNSTHIFSLLRDRSETPIRLLLVCIWRFLQHLLVWWNVLWRKLYACSKTQNIYDYCYCDDILAKVVTKEFTQQPTNKRVGVTSSAFIEQQHDEQQQKFLEDLVTYICKGYMALSQAS